MSSLASNLFSLFNGQAVDVRDVSALPMGEFRGYIIHAVAHGMRLSALFCQPVDKRRAQLWAVLADDRRSLLIPLYTETGGSYPSLTPQCPQAHWFEREIFEQFAVKPL
ncbi:MAG TPA: NADH-quinone oxidoreductase subunit C, partial [Desulfobaccales bacterium]|nr:NADH-quinone oxidoreductase subunit C [Desulfobaccales bacterium]